MGPGTPAQTATGSATHRLIQEGRWLVGDYEQDQFLEDGTFVLTWQLHPVCGRDPSADVYRATIADNCGRADVLQGRVEGDRMIFETIGERPPLLRLTWDASSADSIRWSNEMSLDGTQWMLVEEYEIVPSG
jgi:hypothetical protein